MAPSTPQTGPGTPHCVGIGALAKRIDRQQATVRMWVREGVLPEHLHPVRDTRQWRWWTEAQAREIEELALQRYPGSGLPWYNPTPEDTARQLRHMRGPKDVEAEDPPLAEAV